MSAGTCPERANRRQRIQYTETAPIGRPFRGFPSPFDWVIGVDSIKVYCILSSTQPIFQASESPLTMPIVTFHKNGQTYQGEVKPQTNLVVRAGIKEFPFPHLKYECGMGKCSKCATRVLAGAEHLPPPNWKEKKQLGERLDQGYRLTCQLWLEHDIELVQE